MNRIKYSVFLLLLIILLLSAYSNSLYSPPILDDYHSFILEPKVRVESLSIENLISLSETFFGWKRWIPMMSFAVDYLVGKGSIVYFHLTNFIVHLMTMLAALFLVFQITEQARAKFKLDLGFSSIHYALWIAALWALNPIQTNAVTYLVQRMASIQAFFFILCVALYVKGRRESDEYRRKSAVLYYLGTALSCIGAFLSKENSAMLPVVLICAEWWFFRPDLLSMSWNRFRTSKWVFQVAIFMVALGFCLLAWQMIHMFSTQYGGRHFTMGERLLTQGRVVVWYISLLLWPALSRMSIEHDVAVSHSLLNPPTTLAALLLLALLLALIIIYKKRFPLMTFGGLWFFLNLFIESSFVPLELVFEHRLYLPSVGFFIFLVFGFARFSLHVFSWAPRQDFLKVSWCLIAIACSSLTLLTFNRNEAWQSGVTIYQDAVSKAPLNPRTHANCAVALGRAGRYEEAIEEAKLSIKYEQEKYEQHIVAANAIVASLIGLGRNQEAIEEGARLLRDAPKNADGGALPNLCLNIAEAHKSSGDLVRAYSSAIAAFKYAQRKGDGFYDKQLAVKMLTGIVSSAKDTVDLDQDGEVDPGELSTNLWLEQRLSKLGNPGEVKELLGRAPLETHAAARGWKGCFRTCSFDVLI